MVSEISIWYDNHAYDVTDEFGDKNDSGHGVSHHSWDVGHFAWAVLALDVNTTRPNACCHYPINKGAVRKRSLYAIKARNLSWAGAEQGGRPEWGWSLLEPV